MKYDFPNRKQGKYNFWRVTFFYTFEPFTYGNLNDFFVLIMFSFIILS